MALRGAPIASVKAMKGCATARESLARWLRRAGLADLPERPGSDHEVAAAAAALGAWQWRSETPSFLVAADPPHHPFDFVC